MTWFRVCFDDKGRPVSAIECEPPSEGFSIEYVFAKNQSAALSAAVREYARRKTADRRAALKQEGRCRCGRRRNSEFSLCDVCRERGKQNNGVYKRHTQEDGKRTRERIAPYVQRDEKARVEKNLERQRDRRNELRLEALLEVRAAFAKTPTMGAFAAWLAEEIRKALSGESRPMSAEEFERHILSMAESIQQRESVSRRAKKVVTSK